MILSNREALMKDTSNHPMKSLLEDHAPTCTPCPDPVTASDADLLGRFVAQQDQNAFATTTAFSDKYGVKTLSDLAAKCNGAATVLGGPAECPQRPKCQQGLVDVYNFQAGKFSSLDAGGPLTKTALKTATISVGLVFSSDSALAAG